MKLLQFILQKKFRSSLIILVLFLTSLFIASPTHAQVVFSDDFSDGYTKWYDVRNSYELWSIINNQADVYVPTRSTLAELIPKNEYWNSDWKNYIYKLEYTYLDGADKLLSFWYQDILNWYQIHFVGNNYILSHIENGKEIWKKSGGLILEKGKTHLMEVHLNDGNISLIMDDSEIFNYFDETFDNDYGRIGIKSGAGNVFPTHVVFDNIEVSLINSIEDFLLNINLLRQTDSQWNTQEYDSASEWAESTTINDWGCLITSITMVLDYHGITQFSDGTSITPSTLNTWLQSQEDGYVGEGLVNWSAITRLVKEIHDTHETIKLEYSRVLGDSLETAINEIQELKPVILQVTGHFVVGNGYTHAQDDLLISDPSYSLGKLSEHIENERELLSTRLLTPSNTDLSYIHILHSSNISLTLTNNEQLTPDNYSIQNQSLTNLLNTERSKEFIYHEIQKPESQNFFLEITSNTGKLEPYELTIFTYDIDANYTNLSYSGIAGAKNETENNLSLLTIEYNKFSASKLHTHVSFQTLLNDISEYKNQSMITKNYVAFELSELTRTAQENIKRYPENLARYKNAILQLVDWYSPYIHSDIQKNLKTRISQIK